MTDETNKNVQHRLALQSLQNRVTSLERSAHTLRELLQQRLGEHGIVDLIESLERLGAGSAVLLETPTTESVSESPRDRSGAGASTASALGAMGSTPLKASSRVASTPPKNGRTTVGDKIKSSPNLSKVEESSEYSKKIDRLIYT